MENLKLVDAFTDFVEESTLPYRQMMTYYNCALMEVETKFKVLNEQFSLFYDRNPIESIHTRIKSQSSILKKLQKKNADMIIANSSDIRIIHRLMDGRNLGTLFKAHMDESFDVIDFIKNIHS